MTSVHLARCRQDFGPDVDHVLAGWQHRYKGARALDCFGSAFRKRYACFRGGHLRLLTEIETRNLKAGLDEIGGHRPAHIAEPDESDSLVVHHSLAQKTGLPAFGERRAAIACSLILFRSASDK